MVKVMTYEYVTEFPSIMKLIEIHGHSVACKKMGLSDLNKMINEKRVRPAFEMAAKYLLGPEQKTSATSSIIVKLTDEQRKIFLPLLDGMKIQYMDLDL